MSRARVLRRIAIGAAIAMGVAFVAIAIPSLRWWHEGRGLASTHRLHLVSHPGWSFPARVVSRPLPLTAPAEHLLAHARALDYVEDCSKGGPAPGAYCPQTQKVAPRSGSELEPVLLGLLIGPDAEIREHLPLDEAPKHLVDAILVAEDREFYEHSGVNLSAILRASLTNVKEGSYRQGASTLTMQLVRNLNQRKERTLTRKWREMVMALGTESELGKSGVLQMYLDTPYLGQLGTLSICGFAAAARHYFGKAPKELSLAEAATLAAILPAPGRFAPDRHPEQARERRDRVLQAMKDELQYDVAAALEEPIRTIDPGTGVLRERFPSYLSVVRAELERKLALETIYGAGLVVTVGIDVYMQAETEQLFRTKTQYFEKLVPSPRDKRGDLQAAGVLIDVDTSLIRAVYGGSELRSTDFNRATHAKRQGGSAFKPVVYALALSQSLNGRPRFSAATIQPNAPRAFETEDGPWRPRNVMGEYTETACLAYALAWSQNIATASLLEAAGGPKRLIEFASSLGFDTSRYRPELGLSLGQGEVTVLEMTEFAAMLARGGTHLKGTTLLEVVDAHGNDRLRREEGKRSVLSPETAALVRELMRLVIDYGTGGAARGVKEPGYFGPAMGKTGTTDGEKDLWFIGATPRYAAALWLGYDHPSSIGASASDLASPLWGWWLHRITKHDGKPPAFPEEPKLTTRSICTISGRVAGPACRAIPAPFLPGTEPKEACPLEHLPEEEPEEDAPPAHESLWKRVERESGD